MHIVDLRSHFAHFFQPPRQLNGSRLTFHFSLTSNGYIIGGEPQTVWFGLQTNASERRAMLEQARNSLVSACFPVPLNAEMAGPIPGDVLFLQFEGGTSGTRVYLGSYGSHVSPDDLFYRRW